MTDLKPAWYFSEFVKFKGKERLLGWVWGLLWSRRKFVVQFLPISVSVRKRPNLPWTLNLVLASKQTGKLSISPSLCHNMNSFRKVNILKLTCSITQYIHHLSLWSCWRIINNISFVVLTFLKISFGPKSKALKIKIKTVLSCVLCYTAWFHISWENLVFLNIIKS